MKKVILFVFLTVLTFTNASAQSVYSNLIEKQITSLKEETKTQIKNSIQEENRLLKSGLRDVSTYTYILGECKPQIVTAFSAFDNVIELADKYKNDEYKLKQISQALEQIRYISHDYYSGRREVKIHLRSGRDLAIYNLYNYVEKYE